MNGVHHSARNVVGTLKKESVIQFFDVPVQFASKDVQKIQILDSYKSFSLESKQNSLKMNQSLGCSHPSELKLDIPLSANLESSGQIRELVNRNLKNIVLAGSLQLFVKDAGNPKTEVKVAQEAQTDSL